MNLYYQQFTQADQRREQLLREAEAQRLSQAAAQPGLTDRLLTSVADWMVSEGTRLRNRTDPIQREKLSAKVQITSK
jgi:hypothetical protein